MNLWVHPFFCLGLGGLWADQALGVLGVYPLLRVLLIRVPPLRRVTFSWRRKSNQKGLLLRTARSLGLGVPSLRDPSAQPSDVARGSRSRAAAELTLILLSGEERGVVGFGFVVGFPLAPEGADFGLFKT